ncbi:MAG: leucine-rich repeat domain-containing protein [Acetatifactor sp.]|nr:leucine-rich repeat domain-containing protein [Acetatifactor sp.]
MKKRIFEDDKSRYVLGLAVLLAGFMLGGCGMGEAAVVLEGSNEECVSEEIADEASSNEECVSEEIADEASSNEKSTRKENTYETTADESSLGEEHTREGNAAEQEASPLLEQLYSYEVDKNYGHPYLILTGIAEKYQGSFWENMDNITGHSDAYGCMLIPTDINGMPVKVIGENAFDSLEIKWLRLPETLVRIEDGAFRNTGIGRMELPENLEYIGAEAFAGCGLERLQLPDQLLTIGERAFAGSPDLWTVLIRNGETVLGDGAFADCREGFLLCYGDYLTAGEKPVAEYAREQGIDCMEIILSQKPIVNYASEPLVLKPEIGSFFYGDYWDSDEELWCSWEEDEDAPNFGYTDWQAPGCSSWCGAYGFEQEVQGSSELASADGRYAAGNVLIQDRQSAWAEGAEGPGIGESLTYCQSCTYSINNKWEAITYGDWDPELDGFMRYSEICIVNGYAKTRQTWEENGRIKKLLLYVEGKPYAYLELEDTVQPQYFMLPEDDIKVINGGMLEARFEIVEVYPGSKYEDTCLTGLIMEFTGRYAH